MRIDRNLLDRGVEILGASSRSEAIDASRQEQRPHPGKPSVASMVKPNRPGAIGKACQAPSTPETLVKHSIQKRQ
jgi:hypothetical protein